MLWAKIGERVRAGEDSLDGAGGLPVTACPCQGTAPVERAWGHIQPGRGWWSDTGSHFCFPFGLMVGLRMGLVHSPGIPCQRVKPVWFALNSHPHERGVCHLQRRSPSVERPTMFCQLFILLPTPTQSLDASGLCHSSRELAPQAGHVQSQLGGLRAGVNWPSHPPACHSPCPQTANAPGKDSECQPRLG